MKHSALIFVVLSIAVVGLMAFSQGVAQAQNRDRTGAPGSDPVCSSCHNGPTSASAFFQVLDVVTQESMSAYTPGQEYLVRMVIAGGEASSVYGIQSTVVLSDGSNAGSFSAPSPNAQLEDVDGRHIVEHNFSSVSNVFEVTWTAPAVGSGNADFYMSALECNGNGSVNGDGYMPASLSLPEESAAKSTFDPATDTAPNWGRPLPRDESWTWIAPESGRFVVTNLSGRVIQASQVKRGEQLQWSAQATTLAIFVNGLGNRKTWKLPRH